METDNKRRRFIQATVWRLLRWELPAAFMARRQVSSLFQVHRPEPNGWYCPWRTPVCQ